MTDSNENTNPKGSTIHVTFETAGIINDTLYKCKQILRQVRTYLGTCDKIEITLKDDTWRAKFHYGTKTYSQVLERSEAYALAGIVDGLMTLAEVEQ